MSEGLPPGVREPVWLVGAPAPAPPAAKRSSVLSVLLVVLAVVLVAWLGIRLLAPSLPRSGPPPGHEEQRQPLGAPPLGHPTDGPYTFLQTQRDGVTPVAYSPCRPIHYVVRPDGEPPGGDALLAAAISRISEASGLQFVADGATQEAPGPDRDAYQPDRYGNRWVPVLVAWSTPAETPELAGDVAGSAGSSSVVSGGTAFYVTGQVVLDGPSIAELMGDGANGLAVAQGVVTHEMAHLVGLGHVDDPDELMNPTAALSQTYLAHGDLAGLARAGTGPCAPHL
ncbi:MAG TPA: matrixin family metalloprotease [Cellulomonas sp.]